MSKDYDYRDWGQVVPVNKTYISPSSKRMKKNAYKGRHFAENVEHLNQNKIYEVNNRFDFEQAPDEEYSQEVVEGQNVAVDNEKTNFVELVVVVVLAFVVAMGIRTYVAEPYRVPTGSMLQTIQLDDMLVGEKVSLHFSEVKPHEIITFVDPDNKDQILIKRVIATGGQTVDIKDGSVYVDGKKLNEPYVCSNVTKPFKEQWSPNLTGPILYPFKVPSDCVWVMGDNRENSADSRYFGAVKKDSILSRAKFIFWPPKDISKL